MNTATTEKQTTARATATSGSANKQGSKQATSDIDIFVPENQVLSTISGEKIQVPPVNYGKDLKISRIVSSLLGVIAKSGILTGREDVDPNDASAVNQLKADTLAQLLNLIFTEVPEKISEAMGILLSTPDNPVSVEWVEDNLTSETVLGFLLPFLASKRESISLVVNKHSNQLAALVTAVSTIQ